MLLRRHGVAWYQLRLLKDSRAPRDRGNCRNPRANCGAGALSICPLGGKLRPHSVGVQSGGVPVPRPQCGAEQNPIKRFSAGLSWGWPSLQPTFRDDRATASSTKLFSADGHTSLNQDSALIERYNLD